MAGGTEEIPTLSGEVFVLTLLMEELLAVVVRTGIMPRPDALRMLDAHIRAHRHPSLRAHSAEHPVTRLTIDDRLQELRDTIACSSDVPPHAGGQPPSPRG